LNYNITKGGEKMEQIIVDIFTFQKEAGLDYNTLKELYLIFADEIKQEKAELEDYLSCNKIEELISVIHKIKGIASSYRTPIIFNYAGKLETELKNWDFDNMLSDIDKLNKAIDQVTDIITMYFES
jgi:HPt (histidine-containing phosphotransfer) domain-containing protein